jgi:hypothetical protein
LNEGEVIGKKCKEGKGERLVKRSISIVVGGGGRKVRTDKKE